MPNPLLGSVETAVAIELPLDDRFREACKARIAELGLKQGELSEHIGVAQSAISQALSIKTPQAKSIHAHAISLALGVTLPDYATLLLVAAKVAVKEDHEKMRVLAAVAMQIDSLLK
jgi:transcriptional regulator with XRE-family HTH domain